MRFIHSINNFLIKQRIMRKQTQIRSPRNLKCSTVFFFLLCFSFAVFLIYMFLSQYSYTELGKGIILEALNNPAVDPSVEAHYIQRFESNNANVNGLTLKTRNQNEELKYILLWTPPNDLPFNFFGTGRAIFIKNKCEFTNCFVTGNKGYLGGDVTKFDAIAFNGRNMRYIQSAALPQQRSPHQKYIFFNVESSTYQPVCNPWWEDFFNWTSTYKLNSDVMYSYIYIRDKDGVHVGPRNDMTWIEDMKEIDDKLKEKLKSKKKAAAWFVSHCISRSKREKYVKLLQKSLEPFKLTVDIYGRCGPLKCHGYEEKRCNAMVASDYYFYLSFENAFAEDYVTEKLLTALNNDAVPIVLGGSNYTRFLPPGSYINAGDYEPEALAALMAEIISNSTKYHDFFRWRNHYSYSESERVEDVCHLCTALNNQDMVQTHFSYTEFRTWWNPIWKERCQEENWST